MGGSVAETGDLVVLSGQVHDRVEHEVGDPERALDPRCREVPDRHGDVIGVRLGTQLLDHRLGEVDAVYGDAAPTERQGDAAGSDAELEGCTVAG